MKTIEVKTTVQPVRILAALGSLALAVIAQAVSPAPDGGYPGGNTAEGDDALLNLTTGGSNTSLGYLSLKNNTTGNLNTATGAWALYSNTATGNTATGALALFSNGGGSNNTAHGTFALFANTIGGDNTGIGERALLSNTADRNTAVGSGALKSNTTGTDNTAMGAGALEHNTTNSGSTAVGSGALASNTSVFGNTAVGFQTLNRNTDGGDNTAVGTYALQTGIHGNSNTATGYTALAVNRGNQNTAIGSFALPNNPSGSNNVVIGAHALELNLGSSDDIVLGSGAGNGIITASHVICIGAPGEEVNNSCYIGHIFGATSSGGSAVYVTPNGRLGTATSSRRFKEQIKPMDAASEALFSLKPVTFRYKKEIDPQRLPQFGLIAEEVERVSPNLVIRDAEGKPQTVRYEQINAMLLNEFLKEHQRVQEQEATISQLRSTVARQEVAGLQQRQEVRALAATLKQQAAQIQKVSAQLQLNKPILQMATNHREGK
jgi:hypothetical protein